MLLSRISNHQLNHLSYTIWDEYTRRQYLAKAPHLNPYGAEETPKRFRDFDIVTKIRVLHQLTVWTFWNPDRIREKMPDHPREVDQLEWVSLCAAQLEHMLIDPTSESRSLVTTVMIDNTTYWTTIASTVGLNLHCHQRPKPSRKPTRRKQLPQDEERANEED